MKTLMSLILGVFLLATWSAVAFVDSSANTKATKNRKVERTHKPILEKASTKGTKK